MTPNDDLLIYAGVNRGVKAGNYNGLPLTPLTQDEYGLVQPDNHWQVTGFIRNFTDSRAQNSAFDLAIVDGSDEQSLEKPRRYGVSLRYTY